MKPYLRIVKDQEEGPKSTVSFSFPEKLENASLQRRDDFRIITFADDVYEETSKLTKFPTTIITIEKILSTTPEIKKIQREIFSFYITLFCTFDTLNATTPEYQITTRSPWKAEIKALSEKIKIEEKKYLVFKDEVLTKIREIIFDR